MYSIFEGFELINLWLNPGLNYKWLIININIMHYNLLILFLIIFITSLCILQYSSVSPTYNNLQKGMEIFYRFILNIIKEQVGIFKKNIITVIYTSNYFGVILVLGFTILFFNLIGLFPYSYAITGLFSVTIAFSMTFFVAWIVVGITILRFSMVYLFIPAGISIYMLPLMFMIELISFLMRPLSLAIRLFANILAGHVLLNIIGNGILSIMFGLAQSFYSARATYMIMAGVIIMLLPIFAFFIILEIGVAFLQTYVFVTLVAIYLKDSLHSHRAFDHPNKLQEIFFNASAHYSILNFKRILNFTYLRRITRIICKYIYINSFGYGLHFPIFSPSVNAIGIRTQHLQIKEKKERLKDNLCVNTAIISFLSRVPRTASPKSLSAMGDYIRFRKNLVETKAFRSVRQYCTGSKKNQDDTEPLATLVLEMEKEMEKKSIRDANRLKIKNTLAERFDYSIFEQDKEQNYVKNIVTKSRQYTILRTRVIEDLNVLDKTNRTVLMDMKDSYFKEIRENVNNDTVIMDYAMQNFTEYFFDDYEEEIKYNNLFVFKVFSKLFKYFENLDNARNFLINLFELYIFLKEKLKVTNNHTFFSDFHPGIGYFISNYCELNRIKESFATSYLKQFILIVADLKAEKDPYLKNLILSFSLSDAKDEKNNFINEFNVVTYIFQRHITCKYFAEQYFLQAQNQQQNIKQDEKLRLIILLLEYKRLSCEYFVRFYVNALKLLARFIWVQEYKEDPTILELAERDKMQLITRAIFQGFKNSFQGNLWSPITSYLLDKFSSINIEKDFGTQNYLNFLDDQLLQGKIYENQLSLYAWLDEFVLKPNLDENFVLEKILNQSKLPHAPAELNPVTADVVYVNFDHFHLKTALCIIINRDIFTEDYNFVEGLLLEYFETKNKDTLQKFLKHLREGGPYGNLNKSFAKYESFKAHQVKFTYEIDSFYFNTLIKIYNIEQT